MNRQSQFRLVFIAIAVVAAVSIVGWLSNANSKAYCRQQVGSWLFTQPIGGNFFYLLDRDEDEEVRAMFRSMGAEFSVLGIDSDGPKTWPRLSVKTHTLIPFIISVDYFWEREPEIGGGATRWFLCFFGRVLEIGETSRYST